jgi:beta-glucanase (GH16 family)
MLHLVVSLLLIVVFNDVCLVIAWNPTNFSFDPGNNYELVWQDEFENVGPVKAIINGRPAYAPNPKNWGYKLGYHLDDGIEYYTDSIENAYVQDDQLTIVALEGPRYTSADLHSQNLQEFTFGIFAAKIRLPYGKGMWPAWWLHGNDHKYNLSWPTTGEIDILEMYGGTIRNYTGDSIPHATVHWNNESNTMNPVNNKGEGNTWKTPDGSMLHDNNLVYWAEWTPTNITIGVNEFVYLQVNTTNLPDSINPSVAFSGLWPYFMRLNIAITPPDDSTVWPQQMIVEWVRVYQQKKTIINK